MEQDIRDLFKEDGIQKELPQNHREEFVEKLNRLKDNKEPKVNYNFLFKIAAALIVFMSVGYFMIRNNDASMELAEESPIEVQIKAVEKQYLASIHEEWKQFLAIAEDENLVKRYEQKLQDLDSDYQDISREFRADNHNILVVEALVENLQRRLQLLKDIQEHIKLLNQKSEQYETTI